METKQDIINRLRKEILAKQGFKPELASTSHIKGLSEIEAAFPNGVFPTGMIHEMLFQKGEEAAACSGFLGALLSSLIVPESIILWISVGRNLFPPSIKTFGIEPHQIVFVDAAQEKQVLWALEEGLKCQGITAVVAELRELSFSQSKRLQLAIEESHVTGFVLRTDATKLSTTTCVSRWQVSSIPSAIEDGLCGVGFPKWNVELLRVRNGQTGKWEVKWHGNQFQIIPDQIEETKKAINYQKLGRLRA